MQESLHFSLPRVAYDNIMTTLLMTRVVYNSIFHKNSFLKVFFNLWLFEWLALSFSFSSPKHGYECMRYN